MTSIDSKALRNALGTYPTGVTVVTTVSATGEPVGFTANSFTSVSLSPPMLLVCPGRSLTSFPLFEACTRFAVNILAEGQEEVANVFARHAGDRFEQIAWHQDGHGLPLIDGAAAAFSCATASIIPAGDHIILLGEVDAFCHAGSRGLGYVAGRYFSLGLEQAAAEAGPKERTSYVGAILLSDGKVLLIEGADGWSVPKVAVETGAALRTTLTDGFKSLGCTVDLGQTYSIFDGPKGEHFTHFLANSAETDVSMGKMVSLDKVGSLPIASAAKRAMLNRFVRETESKVYGFYVGDSMAGYVHAAPTNT